MSSPLADVQLTFVDSIDSMWAMKQWAGERRSTPLAFDTESSGLSPERDRLRLIQLGDMHHGWACAPEWFGGALEILRNYEGELLAHNLPHDYRFLYRQCGLELPWHKLHDTLLLAALDDPMRPRGLKPLSKLLVDPRVDVWQKALDDGMKRMKWDWGTVPFSFGPYIWYSALDPVLTAHMWNYLYPRVKQDCPTAYELELGVNRVCTNMMLKGILLDQEYVAEAREKLEKYATEARYWLDAAYGITSMLSAKQISKALTEYGEPPVERTPTGLPKMNKEFLSRVRDYGSTSQAREIAQQVLGVRHAEKLVSAYLDNFTRQVDADGAVRCSIWQAEAVTGRMSCTSPALQTLSRDDTFIRGSFIPRPGNVFISCDYSQVEARIAAHFGQDAGLIRTFAESDAGGPDFFASIASRIWNRPVSKEDQERQMTKNVVYGCVPLDTRILTRRGLLNYDQVKPGDWTVGYNPASGASEWTKITAVHRYDSGEVFEASTRQGMFACTLDHRWPVRQRVDAGKKGKIFVEQMRLTSELTGDSSVVLAAPLSTTDALPLTTVQAALLGWMLTDGEFQVAADRKAPSQRHGNKRGVKASIRQSRKKFAAGIELLLAEEPGALRSLHENGTYVTWHMRSAWARDIAQRAGMYDSMPDPVTFASSLSREQAAAMLLSMQQADGNPFGKTHRWVIDLYSALVFFSGRMPAESYIEAGSSPLQTKPIMRVYSQKPVLTGQRLKLESAGYQPVWCVTTELGTWAMQQNRGTRTRIMLTGNSIYGAGAEKMAQTAGVPVSAMAPVKEGFDRSFPGLKAFMDRTTEEARETGRREGRPAVRSGMGRYLPVEKHKEYVSTNRVIQAEAAEVLKRAMLDLDAAGLGEYMILPIHDEILFDIPVDEAEEAKKVIEDIMSERDRYMVPLTASAKILPDRWVK
jgi:DNA polymerase I-like protein with 3'-5' exonuclease and polymerase domains